MSKALLSQDELNALLQALIAGHNGAKPDEGEALALVRWAENVKTNYGLLGNLLNGHVSVHWREDDWAFVITQTGIDKVERMIDRG